jgi:uncharacterized protein with PhoU and TrkA domain
MGSSYPGRARENVSLLILSKSLEELSDAALRLANVVRYGQLTQVISSAVGGGEEAYVRVRVEGAGVVELGSLDLEDRGFIPLALYKPRLRDWIAPVAPAAALESGDELILKYYKGGVGVEERMLKELRSLGLKPVRVEPLEHTS